MLFRSLFFILLSSLYLYANSTFGSIATGSKHGTYIQIGKDISKIFKKYKANLTVLESHGSLSNLDTLVGKDVTHKANWAIVQNDALDYYRFLYFKDTRKNLQKRIKTLLPLYSEFIHIFSKKGNHIQFQRGGFLKVGISSRKSGAAITANILESTYGVRFKYVYAGFDKAQRYLKDGVIDIYIDVIAAPSKKYKNLQGLDLVSLPKTNKLHKTYIRTTLSKKEYKWLDKPVTGYAVPSVIITNLVKPSQDQTVGVFLKIILTNYPYLIKHGNPKWKESYRNRKFQLENMHPIAKRILSKQ